MSRIRSIKPEFFQHSELFDAEKQSRLPLRVAYAALWTVADREGRFRWRPRELKLACLPYDELDFSEVLNALAAYGFIVKYESDEGTFAYIPAWKKHQVINPREAQSKLPDPKGGIAIEVKRTCMHVQDQSLYCGELELEGEGNSEAKASGADAPSCKPPISDPSIAERELYERGKAVLGQKAGGLITRILAAKGRNVALARAVIEQASTKQDPLEYAAAAARGPPPMRALTLKDQKQEAWENARQKLRDAAEREEGGGPALRVLPALGRE